MKNLGKTLVLNKYFLNLFDIRDFDDLREKLKDIEEDYDSQGRSYFIDVLIGLKPEWEQLLLKYDSAIRKYVEDLRRNRKQPKFSLKYFQYLAVLFTEIFLDRYYNDINGFLEELNEFLEGFNSENGTNITPFVEDDLKKIAFWMATGSGKTLIMHINYWQILKYSDNSWDNIILITPNEGLSKQHYEELKKSNIPCKIYAGSIDDLKTRNGEILVIDIYKLTENKKGKGVTVDISYFDGKNLVFIDEGHKGQKSEEQKWKNLREEIGKNGFLFEYSATFGQVIGKNKDLLNEYAKAILFDYSYKYFYSDGYGKDFYVYNIREDSFSELQRDTLLTAALLSFYEQLIAFEQHKEELRKNNIEKPLWIFVGSKVSGRGVNSDIVRVIQFFDKITKDEDYLRENVTKILEGNSGLIDDSGTDIFKDKFEYLKKQSYDEIIEGIYKTIFNGKGNLELYEIKNADGEIGIKTSTGERYFGVINIGDIRALKKIIESNIDVKDDYLSRSLFFGINDNNSAINVLIGSKKFIEGWNSWRVSNMGLINMGKGEGPQIIQLFGRGVRLKGKNFSLKREDNSNYTLKILQTLFIFGLNADYMNAFLNAIEKEEVDYKEITIPIRFNFHEQWVGNIYTIKKKESFDFSNYIIPLKIDKRLLKNIKIDLRPKITMVHGLNTNSIVQNVDESIHIPKEYFDVLDWNFIYSEIMNYKNAEDLSNLIIDREVLKDIIESNIYEINLAETNDIKIEQKNGHSTLRIVSFNGIKKLHDIILMILKSYILKFYRKAEKQISMDSLVVEPLTIDHHYNLYPKDNHIILKIPRRLQADIEKVMEQLNEYDPSNGRLPESWTQWDSFIIHFDNHLYTPLIIWKKNTEEIKSIPIRLNEGETKFLRQFREFLKTSSNLKNKEIFLLRNLSKRGVGFFFSSGFYPDFILWVKEENTQHIIFIDPKGIRFLGNFNDDKIQFCSSYIKDVETEIRTELRKKNKNINLYLHAFIISVSPYNDIKAIFDKRNVPVEIFEAHNIYFQEDHNYLNKLFRKVLS